LNKLLLTSSPHIKSSDNTRTIMLDVIIALMPALVMSIIYFGLRSLLMTVVSVGFCVLFEFLYRFLLKKPMTIGNLSAVVTGILLAFNLPVTAPYWVIAIGSFFAIVIVKELFGGIGKNIVNPVLAARAFLFAYPDIMTRWLKPFEKVGLFISDIDVVTTATPLSQISLRDGTSASASMLQMFFGETGGCLGETSAIVLILGGLYLLVKKVISWHIPFTFLSTVAVLTFILPGQNMPLYNMGVNLLSGGLILGAIFMATDYTTSPMTRKGQVLYAIGCGIITVIIRYYGGYPEGVSFAILIMNCVTPLIDKYVRPRRYGTGGGAVSA